MFENQLGSTKSTKNHIQPQSKQAHIQQCVWNNIIEKRMIMKNKNIIIHDGGNHNVQDKDYTLKSAYETITYM